MLEMHAISYLIKKWKSQVFKKGPRILTISKITTYWLVVHQLDINIYNNSFLITSSKINNLFAYAFKKMTMMY